MVKDSVPEGIKRILDSYDKQLDHLCDISQNPYLDISELDLQTILLVLTRQSNL